MNSFELEKIPPRGPSVIWYTIKVIKQNNIRFTDKCVTIQAGPDCSKSD